MTGAELEPMGDARSFQFMATSYARGRTIRGSSALMWVLRPTVHRSATPSSVRFSDHGQSIPVAHDGRLS